MKPADASLVLAPLFDRYAEDVGSQPGGSRRRGRPGRQGPRDPLCRVPQGHRLGHATTRSAEMGLVLWSAVGVGEIGATATNDAGPGYVPVHRIKLTNPVVTLGKKNDQAQVRDFIKVVLANLDGK